MDKTKLVETETIFGEVARERGFYSTELMQRIADEGGIANIDEIPDDIKELFVTSHDITPEWHIRMQAAFQEFTDNAVSKTINFPHTATKKDVREAYVLAHDLGCKGITVYRDGSRDEQVLNVTKKDEETSPDQTSQEHTVKSSSVQPRPRPELISGSTGKVLTGCGNLYVTINNDEKGGPFEVFNQMGKAGGCAASQLEAIGRLASLALRSGIDIKVIKEQLHGIRCPAPAWDKGSRVLSCADGISQILDKRSRQEPVTDESANTPAKTLVGSANEQTATLNTTVISSAFRNMVGVCPDCGNPLHHEEGCLKCPGCGFSKC